MNRIAILSLLPAFAGSLAAQANTVAGLDGRLTVVDQFSYQGRRGAAHPNGEVAFSMFNEMCNPGTVGIPWAAAMQPNHPKFGFIAVREANGRIEQISDWSYCKHAFVSTNYSGVCGTCNTPGGSVMGVNCADAYGVGNNNDRQWLGPPSELDPWLGTWNPVGSYFDQGDPNVGPPNNNDGVRSPHYVGPDPVKNRVVIQESDLLVAGARYFYGIHLMHQGEAVGNRGNNLASRGFTPVWNGSSWTSNNNAVGQVYGSILQHWTGASLNSGGNGNDDGRFFVAVKVTPLGGGQYHFEYAVHNVDNHRGGATLRVPCNPAAVVSNITFGDIDSNALNQWTGAKVGNEIVFTAPANNPLNWNTIYNFGFDCNIAPGGGNVILDEARLGAGASSVAVLSQVPGGLPVATVTNVGTGVGCGSCFRSFYESFVSGFDLQNRGMTMTYAAGGYTVGNGTSAYVAPGGTGLTMGDDVEVTVNLPFSLPYPGGTTTQLIVCSNGFISPAASNGNAWDPSAAALLSGNPRWAGVWHDLVPNNSTARVWFESSASVVRITWLNVPNFGGGGTATFQFQFLPNGTVHLVWQNVASAGNEYLVGWSPGGNAADPGNRDISATLATGWTACASEFPGLVCNASARPVIGTTINFVTTNIPAGTPFGAVLLSFQQALPAQDLTSIGMPGCFGHVVNGVTHLFVAPGASSSLPFTIPNDASLSGLPVVGQSFTFSPPLTPLGAVASNGVVTVVGQV